MAKRHAPLKFLWRAWRWLWSQEDDPVDAIDEFEAVYVQVENHLRKGTHYFIAPHDLVNRLRNETDQGTAVSFAGYPVWIDPLATRVTIKPRIIYRQTFRFSDYKP